jgi:hypothetical protein
VLKFTLQTETIYSIDIIKFVKYVGCYPNISIAFRVILTVSLTVAYVKRSFFKLKFN